MSKEAFARKQPPKLLMQLSDESSALIQHYFTRVCKIAGCFDSEISPFRVLPAAMMAHSKPVFLLLQASSAAQLSVRRPEMRLKALRLQAEAFSALRADISNVRSSVVSDEMMISCIIAGLTSSWYDVNDIGFCHVLGTQILLSLWQSSKGNRLKYQETFILGTSIYWLAISAFVAGDPKSSFIFLAALQDKIGTLNISYDPVDDNGIAESERRIFPHPLTGFSLETMILVGKVGALCRLAQGEGRHGEDIDLKATSIEMELIGAQQVRSNYQDPQDSHTKVHEILAVGEAYRCASLLQLYTTFPHLLNRHAENDLEIVMRNEFYPDSKTENGFKQWQHNWLRDLSFHIVSILEAIPPTSGTRVLQGLPVLIAATWFVDGVDEANSFETPFVHPQLPLNIRSKSKEGWRCKVRDGLRSHAEYVGLQQVSRVLEIVEEVWKRDDEDRVKCNWIVVVASMGLQTLYG